ncbi:hypothetical protein PAPYR_10856 [Paratrimastix pyriformis]|uniref:Uncharacterized protein n=1 Tax=Paratrimastix pyriformis TaxID=342808 RepID=A0ABQ8U500_9EUKA|nr:hypothetical protein PAPYR_10856 [Paratrimastix pyriformis]
MPWRHFVAPCKGLVKLSLPNRAPCLWGCGRTEGVYGPWVDAAFTDHTQLAVLRVPRIEAVAAAMPRILGHLPGLQEAHLDAVDLDSIPGAVIETLMRQCPRLEALHVCWTHFDPGLLCKLPQLRGQLRRLTLPRHASWCLDASFAKLEQLHYDGYTPSLPALAPHLTHLTLGRCSEHEVGTLSEIGLARLHSLTLANASRPVVTRLLVANRATLRLLSVRLEGPPDAAVGSLPAALEACPCLAHLSLVIVLPEGVAPTAGLVDFPPALLNRLCTLTLALSTMEQEGGLRPPLPLHIASTSLRRLNLARMELGPTTPLSLYCPLLDSLILPSPAGGKASAPEHPLVLRCPHLLRLSGLGEQPLAACQPMPCLTRVTFCCNISRPPLAALLAGSPRLARVMGCVCFPDPQALVGFCRAALGLTHLQATMSPPPAGVHNRVALCLPDHLESLDLTVARAEHPGDLPPIEAPGLQTLCLRDAHRTVRSLTLRCPALGDLRLARLPVLTAFTLGAGAVPLRRLRIERCLALKPAGLLALLGQHGSRLSEVVITDPTPTPCRASWPQLSAALCRLPRLTRLELGELCLGPQVTLTCPALRVLRLPPNQPKLRALVLDCPLLEEFHGRLGSGLEQFGLVGKAPFLRLVRVVSPPWTARLAERWPGVQLETMPW